jgi:hypothetical protein
LDSQPQRQLIGWAPDKEGILGPAHSRLFTLECPECGSAMKIISFIEGCQQNVMERSPSAVARGVIDVGRHLDRTSVV